MAERRKIGINLGFNNESNSGIVNYLFSILKGLTYLDDAEKPHIILLYSRDAPLTFIKEIGYPYIEYRLNEEKQFPSSIVGRGVNFLSRKVLKKPLLYKPLKLDDIDVVFPYFPFNDTLKQVPGKIHWLVDFNAYHFPHHYGDGGQWFKDWHSQVVQTTDTVVVSSYDSLEDFKRLYPAARNRIKVLRFAAILPEFKHVDASAVLKKFDVKQPYFMTPNQFWEHKNHMVLLKAFKKVVEQYPSYQLVLTGSTAVNRGKGFVYEDLKQFVEDNQLAGKVKFLGAIDRKEQLALMNNAAALIQPSMYEGWSTIVEESKALNKYIILSDINVNQEQINKNCVFFHVHSSDDLAEKMIGFIGNPPVVEPMNYQEYLKQFSKDIINLFN